MDSASNHHDHPPPPHYVLFSHSTAATATTPATNTLGHPIIQYQFSDDSPLNLLPQRPDEHVIVLELDGTGTPQARSLSKSIGIAGVRVEDAPRAADSSEAKDSKMHIVDIMAKLDSRSAMTRRALARESHFSLSSDVDQPTDVAVILKQFKDRYVLSRLPNFVADLEFSNAILRRTLDTPSTAKQSP